MRIKDRDQGWVSGFGIKIDDPVVIQKKDEGTKLDIKVKDCN